MKPLKTNFGTQHDRLFFGVQSFDVFACLITLFEHAVGERMFSFAGTLWHWQQLCLEYTNARDQRHSVGVCRSNANAVTTAERRQRRSRCH